MEIIYVFIGLCLGGLIVFLWMKNQATIVQNKLSSENAVLLNQIELLKKANEESLENERNHSKQLREELQKQHDTKSKLLQEEIKLATSQMLSESREKLNAADKERLNILLSPLKERLETFSQSLDKTNKENAASKAEMRTAFEEALKRLHTHQETAVKTMREDQERAVKELKEQTERIGADAASLTQALKGDSKMQGDWGEMILEKTLEDCGLIKNQQYFLQENYKDENGNNYRPDAVIEFPNNERAVIDAKVSLTAYQAALKTDDPEERTQFMREHVQSVKKHIDELSAKNYEKIVPGCIGYVLMFIPYESGYSAAIKTDINILQYAYRKHIIVLSPGNLLMALQLTHNMWQNYRINKNVEEILRQSNDLYDKFVGFGETFLKVGAGIQKLQQDYDKAQSQLSQGKGNIVRRLDGMKALGITPKKQLPEGL